MKFISSIFNKFECHEKEVYVLGLNGFLPSGMAIRKEYEPTFISLVDSTTRILYTGDVFNET